MRKTLLIGISGYAQSGKDTAAKALIDNGWERRAFADKLRDVAYMTNPIIAIKGHNYRLARLVDAYGWDSIKVSSDEVREFLQRVGKAGRELFGEDFWIDQALQDIAGPIVVTDVRFPNEADNLRSRGGLVFRIERPGVGPVNDDVSETAMAGYDFDTYVMNDGSIYDLRKSVTEIADQWKAHC